MLTTPHRPNRDRPPTIDDRIREVMSIHFDPKWGAPYWIARARDLDVDPRRDVRTIADLARLGLMRPVALRDHPLEHFIPRAVLEEPSRVIVARTGGTLGRPVWTAYVDDEFHDAFVEPFVAAARHVEFPSGGTWLYVGPAGPHIIARAADAIARRTGSMTPLMVDFDTRWARRLPSGSFSARRYLAHVVAQATDAIATQNVTTIFTTPTLLGALADAMTAGQRACIRGVHYGGMAVDTDDLARFQSELFPEAVHLAGYGNTLFGCCLELATPPDRTMLRYYPWGARVVFGVLPDEDRDGTGTDERAPCWVPSREAAGQLVFTRLDRTMLLANVVERDQVHLITPPDDAPPGFFATGVASPHPEVGRQPTADVSLY